MSLRRPSAATHTSRHTDLRHNLAYNASAVLGCARGERTCSSFLLFRGITRSLGVESHVVGAARDLDDISVGRSVVVWALHVHVTADGAKVLLVEG